MGKIKVIIFDLGGVVFENGSQKAIKHLKNKYSFSDSFLEKMFYGKEALDFRAGELKPAQFWQFIDSVLPSESGLSAANVRDIWYNFYIPPKGMFDLIRRLKQNYKLGIISGNIKERVEFLDQKYDFRRHFDFEVYSFDVGANKPNPILYEKALDKANMDASNCLYIDNCPEHLEPAKRLGMQIILFKNTRQLLKELRRKGIRF